jgi:hypothetical protein
MSPAVRVLMAGLIVGLMAAGPARAGQAETDPAPPTGQSMSGQPSDLTGCSACTLRHRNLTRRANELQAAEEARGDCRIKGDITVDGARLYHKPGDPAYAWTWISEAAGERWFCSVGEAEAAGWRAAED